MKETHKERALNALRYAGDEGIHSFTLRKIAGLQAPTRIWELINKDGFIITTKTEKLGNSVGVRYFLIES